MVLKGRGDDKSRSPVREETLTSAAESASAASPAASRAASPAASRTVSPRADVAAGAGGGVVVPAQAPCYASTKTSG